MRNGHGGIHSRQQFLGEPRRFATDKDGKWTGKLCLRQGVAPCEDVATICKPLSLSRGKNAMSVVLAMGKPEDRPCRGPYDLGIECAYRSFAQKHPARTEGFCRAQDSPQDCRDLAVP